MIISTMSKDNPYEFYAFNVDVSMSKLVKALRSEEEELQVGLLSRLSSFGLHIFSCSWGTLSFGFSLGLGRLRGMDWKVRPLGIRHS